MSFTAPTLADLEAAAPSARILAEGLDFQIDDNGVDTTIRFWVLADDLPAFRNTVAGVAGATGTIGGRTVTRRVPLAHPYEANAYAYSLRIAPAPGTVCTQDGTGHGFRFEDYIAEVKFRTPGYNYAGTYPMVTVSRQSGVEMVTRPGTAYKFPSDNTRLVHEVGVPVQCTQYSLTFHRLPTLDNDLYDSLIGCVNLTAFFGRPAGTMLYNGCSSSGELALGGIPSYEVTQEFTYRRIPHNQIMRQDGAAFEAPVDVGVGNYMLPTGELNNLYT